MQDLHCLATLSKEDPLSHSNSDEMHFKCVVLAKREVSFVKSEQSRHWLLLFSRIAPSPQKVVLLMHALWKTFAKVVFSQILHWLLFPMSPRPHCVSFAQQEE